MAVTEGHLLGGRVRHAQPRDGFRSGIEPVLLAASLPAQTGSAVLEGGSGAGAALLCLAARVPGATGLGVERDPALTALAAANAAANCFGGLRFIAADVETLSLEQAFDHAMANPPYHDPSGTPSPVAGREQARRGSPGLLTRWTAALAAPLRHRGTLTFILPAGQVPACLEAMRGARCAADTLFPLWPRSGRPAGLVLVRGTKGGRAPLRVLAGLVLHREDGRFTPETEAILRDGAALVLT